MVTAALTYALVFAVSTLLTPPQTGASRSADGEFAPCLDPRPFLAARDASELDDEVEIPDEPEDDEPDDHGFAFQDEGRVFQALAFDNAPDGTRPGAAMPSHVRENTTSAPDQPLFLRLCRFLI